MYCKKCGNTLDESALFCPSCGTSIQENSPAPYAKDSFDSTFALLGFFLPLVGLILFFIYENKKPSRAKASAKGALIGFIVGTILLLLLFLVVCICAISMFDFVFNQFDEIFPLIKDALRHI